jgi:branched-chain amino acid transport system permease protein
MNLEYFLQLLVQGIIIGCVYATAALGFVLIYKSSRVINLAHGYLIAIGGFLTYTFYGLFRGLFGASSPSMLSFIPAALCGLAASYLLGMLIERTFLRPMVGQPIISVIMVTIGLGSLLDGLLHLTPFGSGNFSFDPPLFTTTSLNIGSISISPNQLMGAGIAILFLVGFTIFFRRSTLGIAMRAVADDQLASQSVGVSVEKVFAIAWAAAAMTTAAAGFTVGAISGLNVTALDGIGIKVLPAVILGGLDSIEGAIVGGIIVGLLEQLSSGFLDQYVPGGGTSEVAPFVMLILVLLVKPYGLYGTKEIERV